MCVWIVLLENMCEYYDHSCLHISIVYFRFMCVHPVVRINACMHERA